MNELISKKDVLREIISSFEWYHTNYGYRNGADILRDNLLKSIEALETKGEDENG